MFEVGGKLPPILLQDSLKLEHLYDRTSFTTRQVLNAIPKRNMCSFRMGAVAH